MSEQIKIEIGDRTVKGPVYAQVREQIEEHIRNKQVASGDTLPSPAALAQRLSVDKGEIQRAYFELERSGLVKKKTGRDFLGKEKITYLVN
jgi:DNA-binding transcriptional regulator YhcF (GntR family)